MPNPTIVVAHLDDKELKDSIDRLVNYVGNGTTVMARQFTKSIDMMNDAMKDFAITQKVSVDLMKEAWRGMSDSFDAMVAAQKGATGSGGTGKGKDYPPNSVGELERLISLRVKARKELELDSAELQKQNRIIDEQKRKLKEQTTSMANRWTDKALLMPTRGWDEAERKLKILEYLQRRYANSVELSAAKQKRIADAIERTRKTVDNLKPKKLDDVLGMSDKSINEIAAKMRALKQVQIDPKNTLEVKRLGDAYAELKRKQAQLLGQSIQLTHSNNYLAQSFGYIRNRIVYALTLGAITNFAKGVVRIRAEYEMLERSLGILVGSMEKGTTIFNELNEMALKSPFTLVELGTAAKQLTAYNFTANEVVDTTRRLADISSALGVPMERLVYNLGQIKAQGALTARDARDFANAGLAIVPMLAKMYTAQKTFGDQMVTTAQVYDMMSKKMVSYSDVLRVLYEVTDEGGKFFDFQARQADTLKVQLANLTLAYNNMLNEIGASNSGVLYGFIGGLKTLLKNWKEITRAIGTVIVTLGTYKAVATVVAALNSRMFIGSILVNLRNYIRGIKAATGAMATFNAVTKLNPIGFLVSVLAAAVSYFVLFKNEVEETSDAVERFGETGAKAIKKVDTFKKILEGTSSTSSVYKKTLSELASLTEEYGVKLDAEKANRQEINSAIEQTIQLIKEENAERQRANQIENASNTFTEETKNARTELEKTIKSSSNISGGGFSGTYGKDIRENSEAIASIIDEVVSTNIKLIINKNGEELEQGMDKLYAIINKRLEKLGFKGGEIQQIMSGFFSSTSAVEKFAIAIANANEKLERRSRIIDRNKKLADEEIQATTTFTQKVEANSRALRNSTNDAISLYSRIYEIVEIAKKNHTISFDLQLTAQKPPKWMFSKELPELQRLAERFAAIAKSGGHAKGYTAESTYERALQYASAARIKQEEEERKARQKDTKTRTKKSDELANALKQEVSLVKTLQQEYDTLTKKGASHADAMKVVKDAFADTINLLNKDLRKFGLPDFDTSLIQGKDPNKTLQYFKELRELLKSKGLDNLERMKVVDAVIQQLDVKAKTYNLDMITKGLNNELGKLKDEYELAVELDADPELGNVFADMMGIDMSSLPHTVKEYADKYAESLNKYLKGKKSTMQLTGDELRGLTRDDINALQSQVNAGTFNQEWFDTIKKAYDDIQGKRKKDIEDTEKWKNSLIEKYGGLQAKLTKIYKDGVQNQVNAVKTFGSEQQKSDIIRLQSKLEVTDNPADLADINAKIAAIVKAVVDKNPIALKLVQASDKETEEKTAKAYWEDFKKDSGLYAMTFEDMANNSTRAIQLIIDKMNNLKDRVKEDPASMKALMKSLEDAEEELNRRDPFGGIVRSLKAMSEASRETKIAQEELWRAEVDVEEAQRKVDESEDLSPDEQKKAQDNLTNALKRRSDATIKLTQAENKGKKAQENLKSSLQGISNQLGDVKELFGIVSKIFRAGGDDETADAIDAISEGFSIMTTVIMGVVAAMIILHSTTPWLLAIAAALSVIVGLVSFLSGNSNKKITEQVEESERAVKRLENAYKQLEYAAENAFGAATSGAQEAIKANKELQLAELKRQLALEQSRDSKHRDEDRIIEISGQIIDLEHEIKDFTKNAVNDLLGISSHGDFFESMISEMIDAFKNGEDAMEVFEEKWSDMIDNMIMKTIVSQVLSQWVKTLEHGADEILEKYTEEASKKMSDLASEMTNLRTMDAGDASEWIYDNDRETFNKILESMGMTTVGNMEGIIRKLWFDKAWSSGLAQKIMDAYLAMLDNNMAGLQDELDKASLDATGELIDYYGEAGKEFKENYLGQILDKIQENWNFGQDSEKQLSNLQQGIQGVSENTAGALEAYMNGVSQQVYLQSDLLTQIRDAVVGFDLDVQTATMSQILLQLQNSYQTQQAIQQILEGALVPSGRAFAVELIS